MASASRFSESKMCFWKALHMSLDPSAMYNAEQLPQLILICMKESTALYLYASSVS